MARLGSGVRHGRESPLELLLGPRRPLSTPAGLLKAQSGLARRCLRTSLGDSPTLTGFSRAFPRLLLNFFKSVASTNFAIGASAPVYLRNACSRRDAKPQLWNPRPGPKAANFYLSSLVTFEPSKETSPIRPFSPKTKPRIGLCTVCVP